MAWSDTSVTCRTVYTALVRTEQIDFRTKFDDAGALTMADLQFFNTAASADIVKAQALMQATTMDGVFTNSYGAIYQPGFDQPASIAAMIATMIVSTNIVENLSDIVTAHYNIS